MKTKMDEIEESFHPGTIIHNEKCFHQWRVVENFYSEISRDRREYVFYCVHCLLSKTMELKKGE